MPTVSSKGGPTRYSQFSSFDLGRHRISKLLRSVRIHGTRTVYLPTKFTGWISMVNSWIVGKYTYVLVPWESVMGQTSPPTSPKARALVDPMGWWLLRHGGQGLHGGHSVAVGQLELGVPIFCEILWKKISR